MTTQYSIRGVGLHYAVNPTYKNEMGYVPEMEQHTVEVLRELDEKRPPVVLIPERDNSWDPHAVMVRAGGRRIGYVERQDVETFYKLLSNSGKKFLTGTIRKVEVEERGKLYLTLEAEEGLDLMPAPWEECTWPEWGDQRPLLPVKEVWMARIEAEFMIDEELWPCNDTRTAEELEHYLNVWMENSLYDISEDTFRTCERFVRLFAEHPHHSIRQWADRLDRYRTAFYSAKRAQLRMEWWESLMQSEAMEVLWNKWQYHVSYHLRQGLREIDAYLRCLPDQLYSLIGHPDRLFKSIFYRKVPRQVLWGIYTALLLRIRTCRELYIDMQPLPDDSPEYGTAVASGVDNTPVVELPAELPIELQTAQATLVLEKLTQAGLLDAEGRPYKLTGTERSLLVKALSERLGILFPWKVFGEWWGIKPESLRAFYNKALNLHKSMDFQDRLKAVLK